MFKVLIKCWNRTNADWLIPNDETLLNQNHLFDVGKPCCFPYVHPLPYPSLCSWERWSTQYQRIFWGCSEFITSHLSPLSYLSLFIYKFDTNSLYGSTLYEFFSWTWNRILNPFQPLMPYQWVSHWTRCIILSSCCVNTNSVQLLLIYRTQEEGLFCGLSLWNIALWT